MSLLALYVFKKTFLGGYLALCFTLTAMRVRFSLCLRRAFCLVLMQATAVDGFYNPPVLLLFLLTSALSLPFECVSVFIDVMTVFAAAIVFKTYGCDWE